MMIARGAGDLLGVGSTEGVGLARSSDPRLLGLTDSLRRARIGSAALFLVVTLMILLARDVFSGLRGLLTLECAIIGCLGGLLLILWGRFPLSARGVRVAEFLVFGLAAAYLSARQYELMQRGITTLNGQHAWVVSAAKTTTIGTILLTFAYGMFIPNTWRRAAAVVSAMVALPLATLLLLWVNDPEAFRILQRFADWPRVSEDLSTILIAAGLSVYGTHVINSLRNEAFEARQLNQYKLGRRLGDGGMGEVYLAEHQLLKRPSALKLIRPANAGDPISLARFEREVRATARLSHPNTVEIYDYGRTEYGTFFYVMEYLRGMSLDELVKKHGPMPPGRVVYLLNQVCGALSEAHGAGLIHRDVKPANIFSCYRGGRYDVAKLLDFGLVMAPEMEASGGISGEPAREGVVRGTPLYMAPEQITGSKALDHRCDLYALGAVAYMLLTGRPPFEGNDSLRVMTAQVRELVTPPRKHRPEIPEDLERVVLRCLAKSPEERYPDAESLAQAFASCGAWKEWSAAKAALWWRSVEPEATGPLLS